MDYLAKLKELGVEEQFRKNLKFMSFDHYVKESLNAKWGVDKEWDIFISGAFSWYKTPEGFDFWEKIAEAK